MPTFLIFQNTFLAKNPCLYLNLLDTEIYKRFVIKVLDFLDRKYLRVQRAGGKTEVTILKIWVGCSTQSFIKKFFLFCFFTRSKTSLSLGSLFTVYHFLFNLLSISQKTISVIGIPWSRYPGCHPSLNKVARDRS